MLDGRLGVQVAQAEQHVCHAFKIRNSLVKESLLNHLVTNCEACSYQTQYQGDTLQHFTMLNFCKDQALADVSRLERKTSVVRRQASMSNPYQSLSEDTAAVELNAI